MQGTATTGVLSLIPANEYNLYFLMAGQAKQRNETITGHEFTENRFFKQNKIFWAVNIFVCKFCRPSSVTFSQTLTDLCSTVWNKHHHLSCVYIFFLLNVSPVLCNNRLSIGTLIFVLQLHFFQSLSKHLLFLGNNTFSGSMLILVMCWKFKLIVCCNNNIFYNHNFVRSSSRYIYS